MSVNVDYDKANARTQSPAAIASSAAVGQSSVLVVSTGGDDTALLTAAIASGAKQIIIVGTVRYTSQLTVTTGVGFVGLGITSYSATNKRAASCLLKDFNGLGVLFSGDDCYADGVQFDSVIGKTGDNVQVTGTRFRGGQIAVTNAGNDGMLIGADEGGTHAINANAWYIQCLRSVGNGRHGLSIRNTNTSTSTNWPLGVADANVGTLAQLDARLNGGHGLHLGNCIDNVIVNAVCQSNSGYGVYIDSYARNNVLQKVYGEGNTLGEGYIAPNASQNWIISSRAVSLGTGTQRFDDQSGNISNFLMSHESQIGNSDLNLAPWVFPASMLQRAQGNSAEYRWFIGSSGLEAGIRIDTDGSSGTKMTLRTRKTGTGMVDRLSIDENGDVILAATAGVKIRYGADVSQFDTVGFGSPEGVVTGYRGSTFRKMNGTAPFLYVFQGTDGQNTGWVGK